MPESAYSEANIPQLFEPPEGISYGFEKYEEAKGSMKIVILSDRHKTEAVTRAIGEAAARMGWAAEKIDNMKIVISEAVNNAIFHGNLATQRKEGKEHEYTASLDQAAQSYKGLKPVTVECTFAAGRVTVTVEDLGQGEEGIPSHIFLEVKANFGMKPYTPLQRIRERLTDNFGSHAFMFLVHVQG